MYAFMCVCVCVCVCACVWASLRLVCSGPVVWVWSGDPPRERVSLEGPREGLAGTPGSGTLPRYLKKETQSTMEVNKHAKMAVV